MDDYVNRTPRPAGVPEYLDALWHSTPRALLRTVIYLEAATESAEGMFAVGAVVRTGRHDFFGYE
jgi:hypothetical protein